MLRCSEKSGRGAQMTGRQVESCAHAFFFFFSGRKRLSVQTVAADQRLVLKEHERQGIPNALLSTVEAFYRKPVWTVHQM